MCRESRQKPLHRRRLRSLRRSRRGRARRGASRSGSRLEEELLQVRAARETPSPRRRRARSAPRSSGGVSRVGLRRRRPEAHAVEVRIEGEAAPAELEADVLGEEVVRVEVHLLEEEVLGHEEGEERGVDGDAGEGASACAMRWWAANENDVQREQDRADHVEDHLRVDAAAAPLRVRAPAEVEVGEETCARSAGRSARRRT